MTVGVACYGVGNSAALMASLSEIGVMATEVAQAQDLEKVSTLFLPGVGSFDAAMKKLESVNLSKPLVEFVNNGGRIVGVCLGMQLLFSSSEEGELEGLGLIPGRVKRLNSLAGMEGVTLPVHGWYRVVQSPPSKFSRDAYFSHTFGVDANHPSVTATYLPTGSSRPLAAIVQSKNVMGMQFHPERSGINGLIMLAEAVRG